MFKIFILGAMLGINAWAQTPKNLLCVTETPTTSFVAQNANENINIRLYHHYGVKFMPIHLGIVTPDDLGLLSDRADVIADLGNDLNFSTATSNCKIQDEYMFKCYDSKPAVQIINGHRVSMWSVYTSRTIDQSFAGEYRYIQTTIALDIDGKSYYLPMKYNEYECQPDFDSEKLKKLK